MAFQRYRFQDVWSTCLVQVTTLDHHTLLFVAKSDDCGMSLYMFECHYRLIVEFASYISLYASISHAVNFLTARESSSSHHEYRREETKEAETASGSNSWVLHEA